MPTTITVSNIISGSTPFDIYLCMTGGTPCYFISRIEDVDLPYSFSVPTPIQELPGYDLRVTDAVGCIITGTTSI
jgi:hypothetical protein